MGFRVAFNACNIGTNYCIHKHTRTHSRRHTNNTAIKCIWINVYMAARLTYARRPNDKKVYHSPQTVYVLWRNMAKYICWRICFGNLMQFNILYCTLNVLYLIRRINLKSWLQANKLCHCLKIWNPKYKRFINLSCIKLAGCWGYWGSFLNFNSCCNTCYKYYLYFEE